VSVENLHLCSVSCIPHSIFRIALYKTTDNTMFTHQFITKSNNRSIGCVTHLHSMYCADFDMKKDDHSLKCVRAAATDEVVLAFNSNELNANFLCTARKLFHTTECMPFLN